MSISLILFFISFTGIAAMIGRKLFVLKKAEMRNISKGEFSVDVPDLEEMKFIAVKSLKRFSFVALVLTIRLYVKSTNIVKKTSKELYAKTKNALQRNRSRVEGDTPDKREVSKFLKMVSEYKHKIRKIKHKIKEEEGIE